MLVFVAPVGAIVCGHLALAQVRRTGEEGHGLALAATILGWVLTGLLVLFLVLFVAIWLGVLVSFLALLSQVPSGATLTG